jgi:hypothetical protein
MGAKDQSSDGEVRTSVQASLTYYVEVNDVIVFYRPTWADAVAAARAECKLGQEVIVWDNLGTPYPDWRNTLN